MHFYEYEKDNILIGSGYFSESLSQIKIYEHLTH